MNMQGRFKDHFVSECERQLKCEACDFPIFKKYSNISTPVPSTDSMYGHNCLRDNPTSKKLMLGLRKLQQQAHASTNSKLEAENAALKTRLGDITDELVLYKGPIPDAAKPTVNDMKLFQLTREENAPEGMADNCKKWIIDAILVHGFNDEAIKLVIAQI